MVFLVMYHFIKDLPVYRPTHSGQRGVVCNLCHEVEITEPTDLQVKGQGSGVRA